MVLGWFLRAACVLRIALLGVVRVWCLVGACLVVGARVVRDWCVFMACVVRACCVVVSCVALMVLAQRAEMDPPKLTPTIRNGIKT